MSDTSAPEPTSASELTTAAHGEHTTNGVPHGYSSITPFISVTGAREAVEFYRDVFGARVVDVVEMGGIVVHADIDFGQGRLQFGEVNPEYTLVAAPAGEDDCYSLMLYTHDTDGLVERAVAAGATVREPVSYFASGDRYASIRDPFGVRWSIMTRVEDLSEEESARRVNAWASGQEG